MTLPELPPYHNTYTPQAHDHLLDKAKRQAGVGTPSMWYREMEGGWELIDALLAKTKGMRGLREKALPRWPKESSEAYGHRLARSTCYGFFADAVDGLAKKPFQRQMKLSAELPEPLAMIEQDANGEGASLAAIGGQWFAAAIAKGIAHLWVDYSLDTPAATLAEERAQGARPVFKLLDLSSVIAGAVNGAGRIVSLRIRETRIETEDYLEKEVPYILEFRALPVGYERRVHRFDTARGEWMEHEPWAMLSIIELPLVTLNLTGEGRFRAEPPLESLADIERAHYQTTSDHENNLASCVGALFGSGLQQEDMDRGIVLGPNTLNGSQNADAKLYFVEPQGAALQIRQDWIARMESKMRELGARPMVEQSAARTATEVSSSDDRSQTVLQEWTRRFEAAMAKALRMAALWLNVELPEDFAVECYADWGALKAQGEHLRALEAARARGDIDQVTYLEELKRRGVLGESVNVEDVKATAEAEGEIPDMLDLGPAPAPGQLEQPAQQVAA